MPINQIVYRIYVILGLFWPLGTVLRPVPASSKWMNGASAGTVALSSSGKDQPWGEVWEYQLNVFRVYDNNLPSDDQEQIIDIHCKNFESRYFLLCFFLFSFIDCHSKILSQNLQTIENVFFPGSSLPFITRRQALTLDIALVKLGRKYSSLQIYRTII